MRMVLRFSHDIPTRSVGGVKPRHPLECRLSCLTCPRVIIVPRIGVPRNRASSLFHESSSTARRRSSHGRGRDSAGVSWGKAAKASERSRHYRPRGVRPRSVLAAGRRHGDCDTSIRLGLSARLFSMRIVTTPFLCSAVTLSGSIDEGSSIARRNDPYRHSA